MLNLDEILMTVQKPARYIGGEWNAVRKEWTADKVKFLLAFPDVYEVGMSYLGLKILYGILNSREDCLCERAFSPWPDFEDALRRKGIELFSLESRRPIREFDIIGFSLAYELTYTNVLNMLDLGGISVRSQDRADDEPLIIAGGPACSNPEPMAEFIDAFVIGDGEEVIEEVVEAYKVSKYQSIKVSKEKVLEKLAKIEGVYVPSLYDRTHQIKKRVVSNFNDAFYPASQIVPHIQIVHDRIAIEIMRGCKHACKFCQASTIYRPCRERSKEKILELACESYKMTGYDEISLLSLSTGDHSRIKEMIEDLNNIFRNNAVAISVPSLRAEEVSSDIPVLIQEVKKTGLTFAPESGSERLRSVIRKDIDISKLFKAASESFKKGWRKVKLYFMIGLPTEEEEDVLDIIKLIHKISELKRDIDGTPGYIRASVNAFVPKPHTPFQWEGMAPLDSLSEKQKLLKRHRISRNVEIDFHRLEMSYLEAAFSRGDRRLGRCIYEAWRGGARFDGWEEFFDFGLWRKAFEKVGLNPDFYATRRRAFDETLPWDFIDIGTGKASLLRDAPHRPSS